MIHRPFSYVFLRAFLYLTIICIPESLGQGNPITAKNCGKRFAPLGKIVGGEVTEPGEYPWMVSLQQNYGEGFNHICGGSILNNKYVVTAAHCIDIPINITHYEIVVGLYKLSQKDKKPAKTYKLAEIIVHKAYDGDTYENDIALLRTKEAMDFEGTFGFVNGICLPNTQADPTGWATVTGWGDTVEGGNISDVLLAVSVAMIPRHLCKKNYLLHPPSIVPENQICAGFLGRDSCQSDSGGPLIQKDEEGIYTLIGIVSYGIGCAQRKFPGVYTKVASYLGWIEDRIMGIPQWIPTVSPTTLEYTTPAPQKNGTFPNFLLYSSNFQSKLIIMSKK